MSLRPWRIGLWKTGPWKIGPWKTQAWFTGRPTVRPTRTDTPPVIDGRLDDEVWRSAALITEFVQQAPLDGAPATEETEAVLMLGPGEGMELLDRLDGIEGMIVTKDQTVLRSRGLSRYTA